MEDVNLIVAVSHRPTFEEFLGELGLKTSSLGAQLFEVVYSDFFINSPDLKLQYQKYYSVEYATFEKYLEVCHDLKLEEEQADRQYVFKIKSLPSVIDTGYENNQLNVVLGLIKKWE